MNFFERSNIRPRIRGSSHIKQWEAPSKRSPPSFFLLLFSHYSGFRRGSFSTAALINRVFSSLFFQHRVKCTLRPPVHGINRNFKLHPCALSTRRHSATITGRVSLFGKYVATPLSSGFKPREIRNEILLRSFFFFFDVSEDELYEDA